MKDQKEKEEDVTAEEEDQPPWKAGIEEAKLIMEACLNAAHEIFIDADNQKVTEIAIAMYQSVVMMEMERGRLAGLKMQMLAQGVELSAAQILKVQRG